ncbi:ribosome biogenesis GTPase YlqF, partial [Francisella tularensis subsp. holarctica]|nr:ribosome biogenesis GTPase YlqF [Francisella tularensis subsp. holarctica]
IVHDFRAGHFGKISFEYPQTIEAEKQKQILLEQQQLQQKL